MDKETDFYDYSRLISDINAHWCKNTVLILKMVYSLFPSKGMT